MKDRALSNFGTNQDLKAQQWRIDLQKVTLEGDNTQFKAFVSLDFCLNSAHVIGGNSYFSAEFSIYS